MGRIVCTGGSGQVGRALQMIMPEAIYLDTNDYNLLYDSEVKSMYEMLKPDVVIHLAGKVGGMYDNIQHPFDYYYENMVMNMNVLKYATEYRVRRFIGMLSSCAYPDINSEIPMDESLLYSGSPAPTNLGYGYAKRMMGLHIDLLNQQFLETYQYLIPCNLYGPTDKFNDTNSHFMGALLHKLVKAKEHGLQSITLKGDGDVYRQWLYAPDLARIIKYVLENDIHTSFNVAGSENLTLKELVNIAKIACGLSNLQVNWSGGESGQIKKHISTDKMEHIIPFELTPLSQGINKTFIQISSLLK